MDCIFCQHDRSILAHTKLSFAFLVGFPVSKRSRASYSKVTRFLIWELTTEEYTDAFNVVRQVKGILQEKFGPQGFNVGVNCGEAAAQTVFHAHILGCGSGLSWDKSDGRWSRDAGTELLKPAPNDYLQVWPVSRRVNSSRAPGDDPTLIDRVAG